jgi:hypothetical protein
MNGVKLTTARRPILTVGEIALRNKKLGNITCVSGSTASAFNEATEGTEEKGFLNTVGYGTFECKSENPCKVKNTRGAEVEGIHATAEAPPEPAGTEAHETGISSLPWTGELTERETAITQVLTKHVKLWIVFPPNTVGTGSGCLGTEVEVEDREGKTEKAEGDELAPVWLNGTKNGLKGSNEVFEGEEGLTEKGFPRTGRLSSPQVGPFYVKSNSFMRTGGLGGGWELVTVEF